MSITGDKLRVDSSVVKSWFDGPVDSMICHVKDILSEPKMKDVKLMLLVGGFGESRYVQDRMVKEFGSKYVIIPEEAGLAVLKGAVRFGHDPDIMSARVMQYTYGIRILVPYDEFLHPSRKLKVVNGEKKAKDVFDKFVTVGSEIPVGYKVTKRKTPNDMNRTFIPVFRASSDVPYFTTDQGCMEIGFLVINHPEGKSLQDKVFDVTFTFGDTELFVEAKMLHSEREFSFDHRLLEMKCENKI
ncbi:heat shock 70 kDa protein 12A-like [Ruditapes philippinarum]|uniref:heat shock 70 kDa protein 12A-like n=1 Tax=Ruditapes philippinarum TaxID=129788 RepID=UPI00295BF62D|nr:heat shock 70 kDa protein 12A-like [Ruditapes philippinarum]